jgi:hypothetical protein
VKLPGDLLYLWPTLLGVVIGIGVLYLGAAEIYSVLIFLAGGYCNQLWVNWMERPR